MKDSREFKENHILDDWTEIPGALPPGVRHFHFPQVVSTNLLALDQGEVGDLYSSDSQTAGRGRLGRPWFSPEGVNLYFSFVMKPSLPVAEWGGLALVTGLALARVFVSLDFKPELKWPNDLLLGGKKAAGILLEARDAEKLVIGVGINVNQRQFPEEIKAIATSLAVVSGYNFSRPLLLTAVVTELVALAELWVREPEEIMKEWGQHDFLYGKEVTMNRGEEKITGLALGIGARGELAVKDSLGKFHLFSSGEAILAK